MTDQARLVHWLARPEIRRRVVAVCWLAAVVASVVRVVTMAADPSLPGQAWQTSSGNLQDFRDIIWVPGRYLLDGGNPYDPGPYLAANPWAQEFDPYAPAWLLVAVVLAPLPFLVSAIIFQLLSLVVAVVLLRVVCRWALPRIADVAVPVALLWLNIWYPGRGSLAAGSSVVAILGVALVLRSLTGADPRAGDRVLDRSCVLGSALALVKPQFGLPVVLLAAVGGRLREAWRGVAALIVVSIPVMIACSVAAGGPLEFVRSVLRDAEFANSPNAPSGLTSPFQRRIDIHGLLARYGIAESWSWLSVVLPLLALLVALCVIRLSRHPFGVSTAVCSAVLLGFVHFPYDLMVMIIPAALGISMALRHELTGVAERLAVVATILVVLHLHTVSMLVVPGLSVLGADTVDVVLVAIALLCSVYACLTTRRHSRSDAQVEPARAAETS